MTLRDYETSSLIQNVITINKCIHKNTLEMRIFLFVAAKTALKGCMVKSNTLTIFKVANRKLPYPT